MPYTSDDSNSDFQHQSSLKRARSRSRSRGESESESESSEREAEADDSKILLRKEPPPAPVVVLNNTKHTHTASNSFKRNTPTLYTTSSSSSSSSSSNTLPPWYHHDRPYWHANPTMRLHEEILDFVSFLAPTDAEKRKRAETLGRLSDLVQSTFADQGADGEQPSVMPFGSYTTGMYLPTGDIDTSVMGTHKGLDVSFGKNYRLTRLFKALKNSNMVSYIEAIGHAKIPIIKYRDRVSGINVDVSFDMGADGSLTSHYIAENAKNFPCIRHLLLLLKVFIQSRDLAETYRGGCGSFLTSALLIAFVQRHPSRSHAKQWTSVDQDVNLGCWLMGFLQMYGKHFNYAEVGIQTAPLGDYFKKASTTFFRDNRGQQNIPVVVNPLNCTANIGQGTYEMHRVKRSFSFGYDVLESAYRDTFDEELNGYPSILQRLLKIPVEVMKHRRDFVSTPVNSAPTYELNSFHEQRHDVVRRASLGSYAHPSSSSSNGGGAAAAKKSKKALKKEKKKKKKWTGM
jgi:non-canonical poly(A) RNA polymerase PAPD5/7